MILNGLLVHLGFLDEILGVTAQPAQKAQGLFSSLFSKQQILEPSTPPTLEQTKSLATLLSHELSHLLLSHTLESYGSTLLIPQIQKMCLDVFRTLVFPFTALLGPFFNDGIGKSMNELNTSSQGYLGRVCNSCESRKLELEADVVGLRLLAYAGIDPRHALLFWENRLQAKSSDRQISNKLEDTTPSNHLRLHSSVESQTASQAEVACGFLRSHPVNEERVKKIREELEMWLEYNGSRL